MSKFQFMEIALNNPQNRNHFVSSKEAISTAFEPKNKFKEIWRSMFVYRSETPNENDPMFGNFYIESDQPNFQTNKQIILSAIDFLKERYEITEFDVELFFTNKSIWLMVPAKVFAAYGSKHLNKIYKQMAEEVNEYLIHIKKFEKPLDLSIYKWNGLMHSLGSYLPRVSRWVKKFNVSDLEESNTIEDLMDSKIENFDLFNEIKPKEKAANWYKETRIKVLYPSQPDSIEKSQFTCQRECMENMVQRGFPSENRNSHLFSYALYLKEKGFSVEEANTHIQENFDNTYVSLPEAKRTIESAVNGSKNFSCDFAKSFLNEEYLDCSSCDKEVSKIKVQKDTIIVPREFIRYLQSVKAHYDCYKQLLLILEKQQNERVSHTYDLKGLKHKTLFVERMKKLEEAGIARVSIVQNKLIFKLIHQPLEIYKSHIIVPVRVLKNKVFLNMGEEIKVLMELWRSSLQKGKNKTVFFNVNIKNLAKKLNRSMSFVKKLLNILQKNKLIFANRIFTFLSIREWKTKISELVHKIKEKTNNNFLSNIIFSQTEINVAEEVESFGNISIDLFKDEYLIGSIDLNSKF